MGRKQMHGVRMASAWLVALVHVSVVLSEAGLFHALSHPSSWLARATGMGRWSQRDEVIHRLSLLGETLAPALLVLMLLVGIAASWRGALRSLPGAFASASHGRRRPLSLALGLALAAAAMVALGETRLGLGRAAEDQSGVDALTAIMSHPWPVVAATSATIALLLAGRVARRAKLSALFLACGLWTGTRALRGGLELWLAASALAGRSGGESWAWVLADALDWGGALGAVLVAWVGIARHRQTARRAGIVSAALVPLALSLVLSPFDLAAEPGAAHRDRAARVRAVLAAHRVVPAQDEGARRLVPPRVGVVEADDVVHVVDRDRRVSIAAGQPIPLDDEGIVLLLGEEAPSEQLERVARRIAQGPIYLGLVRMEPPHPASARFAAVDDRSLLVRTLRVYRPGDRIVPQTFTERGLEPTRCVDLREPGGPLMSRLEGAHCLLGPSPEPAQRARPLRARPAEASARYRASMPRPTAAALTSAGALGLVALGVGRRRMGLRPMSRALAVLVGVGAIGVTFALATLALS